MPIINTGALTRDQKYIFEVRENVKALWEAINNLKEAQRQWVALDYTNTLPDGADINEGVLAADVLPCVFTTPDALIAVLDAGHATNLAKLL